MKLEKVYMKMADNYFVACRCQWVEWVSQFNKLCYPITRRL